MQKNILIGIVVAVVVLGSVWVASRVRSESSTPREQTVRSDAEQKRIGNDTKNNAAMDESNSHSDTTMMEDVAGSYIPYDVVELANAEQGDVVLFFKASWCPSCRAADADIQKNLSRIPSTVTILQVEYDSAKDLKKQYGVTTQHSFVQVNADGSEIKKWVGSPTLEDIVAQLN